MKLRDMEASAVHAFDEIQASETQSPSQSDSPFQPSSKRRKTGRATIEENPLFALPEQGLSIRTGEHIRWARESLSHEPAIDFWHHQFNLRKSKPLYLYLPLVALAIFGIPRSSAECERDFSILGLLLNKFRMKMAPETIKRKIFLALNKDLWEPNPELANFARMKEWTTQQFESVFQRATTVLLETGDGNEDDCEDSDGDDGNVDADFGFHFES